MNKHYSKANSKGHKGQRSVSKPFTELGEEIHQKYFIDKEVSIFKNEAQNTDKLVEQTESFVRDKGRQFSATQLRNIYGKILQAKDDLTKLKMIRPQLAYLAGRESSY